MDTTASKKRILILGGGFGGVATARHLEGLCRRRPEVEIVLVSRDNFLLMTPLLFEVFSGALDLRSSSFPVRAALRATRFVEATVRDIDLDRRVVRLASPGKCGELAYDQLVLALGSKTNRDMIPGSEHAFTFKTLADALLLRNHVIERFERADVEADPQRKAQFLKVDLDSETALLLREIALGDVAGGPPGEGGARPDSAADGSPFALVESGVRRPKPALIERGST